MVLKFQQKTFRKHKIDVADPVFWVFTKKEIIWMSIFIVIGSFIGFVPLIPNEDPKKILLTLLIFSIIIITNIATKKIIAPHFAIKIEHSDWKLIQWGWFKRAYFKKPLPLGLIAPFFLAIFTIGKLKPFTFFQFESKNIEEKRILKRHGPRPTRRKELINEEDLGYTAASGMYALLILAIIGTLLKPYFPSFGADLAKYSIYYGIWNLLPIGQLDGTKIFFGTTVLWFFLAIIYTISTFIILIP
jgi:hypothetical protein